MKIGSKHRANVSWFRMIEQRMTKRRTIGVMRIDCGTMRLYSLEVPPPAHWWEFPLYSGSTDAQRSLNASSVWRQVSRE